ncbi:hypothetical protein BV898_10696 [Hypsibius exemplaris]|uniref:Uncharacterized protein n=1 Tax=Hypsibius exemplaris TaxID=2072580 RepID=A0A1W0WIM7_HYPEX|nr:hypothetical protein BV898_10696 [Hypsibius exemplaris]
MFLPLDKAPSARTLLVNSIHPDSGTLLRDVPMTHHVLPPFSTPNLYVYPPGPTTRSPPWANPDTLRSPFSSGPVRNLSLALPRQSPRTHEQTWKKGRDTFVPSWVFTYFGLAAIHTDRSPRLGGRRQMLKSDWPLRWVDHGDRWATTGAPELAGDFGRRGTSGTRRSLRPDRPGGLRMRPGDFCRAAPVKTPRHRAPFEHTVGIGFELGAID